MQRSTFSQLFFSAGQMEAMTNFFLLDFDFSWVPFTPVLTRPCLFVSRRRNLREASRPARRRWRRLRAVQPASAVAMAIVEDLEELGAVRVGELSVADWEASRSWDLLRPLQKRRLQQHIGAQQAPAN